VKKKLFMGWCGKCDCMETVLGSHICGKFGARWDVDVLATVHVGKKSRR